MRPVIGITSALDEEANKVQLNRAYVDAVAAAGGIPVVLPVNPRVDSVGDLVSRLDGVLCSGGGDIDPSFYGEEPHPRIGDVNLEWDTHDVGVARFCLAAKVPILGVCRGCQVLNVAAGGSLYQDIPSQLPKAIKHALKTPRWQPGHTVNLQKGSRLSTIMGVDLVSVNSFHHQAVARVGSGFAATAWAMDNVIEGIEATDGHPFALGVQWHPEGMWERYEVHHRVFRALAAAAREYRLVKGQIG